MVKKKGRPQGINVVGVVDKKRLPDDVQSRPPDDDKKRPLEATSHVERKSKKKRKRRENKSNAVDSVPGASIGTDSPEHDGEDDKEQELDEDSVNPAAALATEPSVRVVHASVDAHASGEPPKSPLEMDCGHSSPEAVLAWMVWPMSLDTFFNDYWEKKPLHLRRRRLEHFDGIFSKAVLDQHLSIGTHLGYEERINLARFDPELGRKVVLNKGERGTPVKREDVDSAWQAGASIQVMHPQQFHSPVWKLVTSLEGSRMQSLFGANSYITPGGNQGLAPHYDDVEVFMLQLEGSKRWRLYEPPPGEGIEFPLPREYSPDFTPDQLGEPILDCVVERGDLLYFPRGTVHSGVVEEAGGMSHHLTVSTYMKTAWCHLMERALSGAISRAASDTVDFRAGLPAGFLGYMGSWKEIDAGQKGAVNQRATFTRTFKELLKRLHDYVDIDDACDELGVEFMSQRLPPCLERAETVGATSSEGKAVPTLEAPTITLDTEVRWVDASSVRLVMSADPETSEPTLTLFHSCSNQRVQHMCVDTESEEAVGCLRFEASLFLPALRALIGTSPGSYIRCGDLPLKSEDDRTALCENLCEAGILECRKQEVCVQAYKDPRNTINPSR